MCNAALYNVVKTIFYLTIRIVNSMSMISPEIQDLLKEIRLKRDYFAEDTDEQLIYKILTEWLHYENEEHLNDWLEGFF